jgi:hypothetical protein
VRVSLGWQRTHLVQRVSAEKVAGLTVLDLGLLGYRELGKDC